MVVGGDNRRSPELILLWQLLGIVLWSSQHLYWDPARVWPRGPLNILTLKGVRTPCRSLLGSQFCYWKTDPLASMSIHNLQIRRAGFWKGSKVHYSSDKGGQGESTSQSCCPTSERKCPRLKGTLGFSLTVWSDTCLPGPLTLILQRSGTTSLKLFVLGCQVYCSGGQ
jgi:hypothetical protein